MGLYTSNTPALQEVDIIIAGGGTAACVIASRLADADPNLSILVIESGPNNYNEPSVVYPGFFIDHIFGRCRMNATYTGKKSDHLGGRELPVICGRVLGGGSSINTMMYARGQESDYDAWKTPGWSAKELLPYFKKFETYKGDGDAAHHGLDGPIQISEGSYRCTKATNDLMGVLNRAGWPEVRDLQSMQASAINGVQRSLRYVAIGGKRQDAAHCYLHPRLADGKHPNLHVLVETDVVNVIIKQGKAVGVVYRPNPEFLPADEPEFHAEIKARRLVVLSCGAFGSPAVLERSGIGRPDVLERANVRLVADLPGVGSEYEDHPFINYAYRTNLDSEDTMDAVVFGYWDRAKLIENKAPMLGHNAQDLGLKIRPTEDEVTVLGPDFKHAWERCFKANADKPLMLMSLITCFPGHEPSKEPGQYLGLSVFNAHPFSRGHVHITGPSPSDPIDFDAGFFSDENGLDIKEHIWAYKKQREFMRRMTSFRGEFSSWHPPFPGHSQAACTTTDGPLPDDVPDIDYTTEDDAIIDRFLREKIASLWHSMGTCKMAPKEGGGVVDATLGVHGLQGLKVADLSIAPGNVAANTASTALAIGEKAADLFIHELRLCAD